MKSNENMTWTEFVDLLKDNKLCLYQKSIKQEFEWIQVYGLLFCGNGEIIAGDRIQNRTPYQMYQIIKNLTETKE